MISQTNERRDYDNVQKRLRQDVKDLSNIQLIYNKMDGDGHLDTLTTVLEKIFLFEIDFTVSQLFSTEKRTSDYELKSSLTKNTFIFKESLKSIVTLLG